MAAPPFSYEILFSVCASTGLTLALRVLTMTLRWSNIFPSNIAQKALFLHGKG
jgi:hypothetical protein